MGLFLRLVIDHHFVFNLMDEKVIMACLQNNASLSCSTGVRHWSVVVGQTSPNSTMFVASYVPERVADLAV